MSCYKCKIWKIPLKNSFMRKFYKTRPQLGPTSDLGPNTIGLRIGNLPPKPDNFNIKIISCHLLTTLIPYNLRHFNILGF